MFIERLSNEQIKAFFKERYPRHNTSITKRDGNIYATVSNPQSSRDYSWTEVYYDFSSTQNTKTWVKYLASIFGDEYIDAYLANCRKIFD